MVSLTLVYFKGSGAGHFRKLSSGFDCFCLLGLVAWDLKVYIIPTVKGNENNEIYSVFSYCHIWLLICCLLFLKSAGQLFTRFNFSPVEDSSLLQDRYQFTNNFHFFCNMVTINCFYLILVYTKPGWMLVKELFLRDNAATSVKNDCNENNIEYELCTNVLLR